MLRRLTDFRLIKNIHNNVVRFSAIRLTSHASDEKEIPDEVEKARQQDMPVDMKNPFERPKPMCVLCKFKVNFDYKNIRLLSQFVSPFSGKVYERNITGLCERQYKKVFTAIVKARKAGLMPYYHKIPMYIKDPPLFNPERPIKPHNY